MKRGAGSTSVRKSSTGGGWGRARRKRRRLEARFLPRCRLLRASPPTAAKAAQAVSRPSQAESNGK
eukprot:7390135-Prymnesium_polylepis.1